MKRFPWRSFALLSLPVLVLLLPLLFYQWKMKRPIVAFGGIWKTQAAGDRTSLAGFSSGMKNSSSANVLNTWYVTPQADGKYMKGVQAGRLPYREWIYELEYNRQEKTLTNRLFDSNPRPLQPAKVWVWHNVTEDAIHQVAAPVLKLSTTFQIEAYQGGHLNELKKYGAVLEKER